MASLRTAQAMGTYERRLQYLSKVALLIIDDFGLKPLRPPEDEDFHDLIAERYERTATILTSNLHSDEWGAAFAANKMRALPPASEVSKPPIEKGRKASPK